MKRNVLALATMIALALAPCLVPSLVSAAGATTAHRSGSPTTDAPSGVTDASPTAWSSGSDTWMGAVAAILCGLYLKVTISSGGASVGTIAGAVAACSFAVFDALTD